MRNPEETGELCRYTNWETEFISFEVTAIVLNNTESAVKACDLLIPFILMQLPYCLVMSALCKLSLVCIYFH